MKTSTEPPSGNDPGNDPSTPSTPSTGSPSTTPASTTSQVPARAERIKLVAALVAVGAAALFFIATVAVVSGDDDNAAGASADAQSTWGGTPVDPPFARPDFTLTDTDGQPFDFGAETGGELTLLFFGYTNCPDVCPVHMATL